LEDYGEFEMFGTDATMAYLKIPFRNLPIIKNIMEYLGRIPGSSAELQTG
jgi:hypothetical protein